MDPNQNKALNAYPSFLRMKAPLVQKLFSISSLNPKETQRDMLLQFSTYIPQWGHATEEEILNQVEKEPKHQEKEKIKRHNPVVHLHRARM